MNAELKKEFITFLETRGEYFRKVHEGQYRIRCPFCGDSTKNQMSTNFYINIDKESNNFLQYSRSSCCSANILAFLPITSSS